MTLLWNCEPAEWKPSQINSSWTYRAAGGAGRNETPLYFALDSTAAAAAASAAAVGAQRSARRSLEGRPPTPPPCSCESSVCQTYQGSQARGRGTTSESPQSLIFFETNRRLVVSDVMPNSSLICAVWFIVSAGKSLSESVIPGIALVGDSFERILALRTFDTAFRNDTVRSLWPLFGMHWR